MNKTPCRNCDKREVGCHATCEEYIEMRAALDERNKAIEENKVAARPVKIRKGKKQWVR